MNHQNLADRDQHREWLAELENRLKRMDSGKSRTLDWRDAHAEIRSKSREKYSDGASRDVDS